MSELSIIIPCYNEENTIEKIIDKILNQSQFDKEIIVIDDYSTDNTRKILKEIKDKKISKLLLNESNFGKGYSISKGIENAKGDIILIQDADLEYDPDEYPNMINPILDNKADIVYGSRFKGGQPHRVVSVSYTHLRAHET